MASASRLNYPQSIIAKATEILKSWGLEVVLGKYVTIHHHNAFAGTDVQRTEDLQWALDNPTIKAIFSLRGGYGTTRIIDRLDFTCFLRSPKWVIGFSNSTTRLYNLGVASVHVQCLYFFQIPNTELPLTAYEHYSLKVLPI